MDSDTTHAINELSAHVGQLQEAVRKLTEAVVLLSSERDSLESTNRAAWPSRRSASPAADPTASPTAGEPLGSHLALLGADLARSGTDLSRHGTRNGAIVVPWTSDATSRKCTTSCSWPPRRPARRPARWPSGCIAPLESGRPADPARRAVRGGRRDHPRARPRLGGACGCAAASRSSSSRRRRRPPTSVPTTARPAGRRGRPAGTPVEPGDDGHVPDQPPPARPA